MAQILEDQSVGGRLGAALGGGFSSGLSGGLQMLAQQKMQELARQNERKNQATALQGLNQGFNWGLTPEQIQGISALDPSGINTFIKSKLNPSGPLATVNIGGKSFKDYIKDIGTKAESAESGLKFVEELKELNKSGKLNKGIFGYQPFKGTESKQFESAATALEAFSKTNPRVKNLAKRLKHGDSAESIAAELQKIEDDFRKDQLQQQAVNEILQQTGGNIPDDFRDVLRERVEELQEQLTAPSIQQERANEPVEQSQEEMGQLPDLLRAGGGILAKGVQGLGEGITGLATSPFSLATALSGGAIPTPEIVQSIQSAPERIVKALTGNLTDPQSETERILGDTIQTAASFLSPGGALGAVGKAANWLGKGSKWIDAAAKLLKVSPKVAAATAGAGEAAKFLTKKAGFGESEQELAKVGGMLLVPIIGSRTAGLRVNELGRDLEKAVEGTTVKSPKLINDIGDFYNALEQGAFNPAKDALKEQIQSISYPLQASKLMQFEKGIENISKIKGLGKAAQRLLPEITEDISKAIQSISPEVSTVYGEYKDLSNALKETSLFQNFVKRFIYKRNPNAAVSAGLAALGLKRPDIIVPATALAATAGELERVARMAIKSPAFRKNYLSLLNAASQGSIRAAEQALSNIGKVSKREGQ